MKDIDKKSIFRICENLATDNKISGFNGYINDENMLSNGHIYFDNSYFNLNVNSIFDGGEPPLNVNLIGETKDKEKLLRVAGLLQEKFSLKPFAISKHTAELPHTKLHEFYNGYQVRWAFEPAEDAAQDLLGRNISCGSSITAVNILDKDVKNRLSTIKYIKSAVNNGLLLPDEEVSNEELLKRISAIFYKNTSLEAFNKYSKEATTGYMWADDETLEQNNSKKARLMKAYVDEWSEKNKFNSNDVESMSV